MLQRTTMLILAALILGAHPTGVRAQDAAPLRFAFPAPPTSGVNLWAVTPWVEKVNKESDGTLQITIFSGYSLANLGNVYDRITSNVVEMGYGTMSALASVFPKTQVMAAPPFTVESCAEASVALWRMFEKGYIADEYKNVKVLGLFGYSSGAVHSNKQLKTAADFSGLKLIVLSKFAGEVVQHLGGAPIAVLPTDLYQSLNRGLADGVATGWSVVPVFRIAEVTKYHLDMDIYFNMSPAFVAMNKDAFARLPQKAQAAVDANLGETFSRNLGTAADKLDDVGREQVQSLPGHVVTKLDPNELEHWKKLTMPITTEWVRATPGGSEILAAYLAEIANYRKSK